MRNKLTKEEYEAIRSLISYYRTLGKGDNDMEEGGKEEEDICNGLIKLKNLHDKKYRKGHVSEMEEGR